MNDILPTPSDSGKTPYKKRAIPQATRRAVALAAGAVPGDRNFVARCFYCSKAGKIFWPLTSKGKPGAWVHFVGLELDHIVPESAGGTADPDNITLACRSCNRRKGAKVLI